MESAYFVESKRNMAVMNVAEKEQFEQCECTKFIVSVQDALDVLGGRWKLPILVVLKLGKKRFKEISKEINGISDKILAKELRDLETNQLITRTVYETFPPKVEYTITEHGLSLENVLLSLRNWGNSHRKKIIGK